LRLIADVMSVAEAEDADNRQARRAMMADDPQILSLLIGAFTGPETVPDELFDDGLLERIRKATLA
jgi:hypothetical protein